jgi:putative oxidoreductase
MSLATRERPTTGTLPRPSIADVERRIAGVLRPYSLSLLRYSLGTVFIWFGALKVFDATPVADLVTAAVPFLDASWFVPLLGVVEVALGIALIIGRWLTLVAVALVGHLCGTFLVLVMEPGIAFQHGNPLLLTTEGEFVAKNLVLISAALVLASRLRESRNAS